jgi:hypothetical protein
MKDFAKTYIKHKELFASRLKFAENELFPYSSSTLSSKSRCHGIWKSGWFFGFAIANRETLFWKFFAGAALGFRGRGTESRSKAFKRFRCFAAGQLTSTFKRDTFSFWSKQPLQNIGQPRRLVSQGALVTSALAAAGGEKVGFLRIAVAALSSLGGLFSQELSLLQLWLPQAAIFFEFPLNSSDSTEQPRRVVFQRAFIASVLAAAGRENFGFPSHSNDGIEQPRRLLGLWF